MENMESSGPVYSDTSLSYKQDVIYRQENFPCGRTYRIFPPADKNEIQAHKINITSITNRDDLYVSNLPLKERARLQRYNVKCTPMHYNLMIEAVKYIFHAYSFEFETHGNEFCKTHFFSIAPNINIESMAYVLPSIYRTSICVERGNPKHYSFSTYAIVGGYSDGFYFLNRLDNNYDKFAHICKQPGKGSTHNAPKKAQTVQFPHMHQPSFKYNHHSSGEYNKPYYLPLLKDKDMHTCLSYYLKHNNISSKMLLVNEDMPINTVTECAKYFDSTHTLEDIELGSLGKIAVTNFGHYAVSVEANDFHPKLPVQECGAPYLRS